MDAEVVGDELLCCAPAAAAVGHLPTQPGNAQFLGRETDSLLREHVVDYCEVLLLIRRVIVDDKAKAIREGDGLVDRVIAIELVLLAVVPRLTHEMAAVGCGIEADVRGTGGNAALDGGLNCLELGIRILERDINKEEDEFASDLAAQDSHDLGQLAQLFLCDLHKTKAALFVFTYESLDCRRLARPACANK